MSPKQAAAYVLVFAAGIVVGTYLTRRRASKHAALLRWQAERDPLTGLRNRRAFHDLVAAVPAGEQCALLLFDLDHFGAVNNTHGHAAGDHLLRDFANRLHLAAGGSDFVFRFGGDEFVMLVPYYRQLIIDQARTAALDTAARVLPMVTGPCLLPDGTTVDLQTTIGVSSGDPRRASELLKAADTALYAAKHAGRGRVDYEGPVVVHNDRPGTRLRDTRKPRHSYEESG